MSSQTKTTGKKTTPNCYFPDGSNYADSRVLGTRNSEKYSFLSVVSTLY